jgi:valyl-tRNA synthetase
MKIGRRLAIKLLNASKFAIGLGAEAGGSVTEPIDLAMLTQLAAVVGEATAAFEAYDYTRALDRSESFFWRFCDDYVELVKGRAYGSDPAAASAKAALGLALSTLQRLFAPFLPFVTDEVWSWWQSGSVHRAAWPTASELPSGGDPAVFDAAAQVLTEVRKAKTTAKRSLKADVESVVVTGPADLVRQAESDLLDAGRVRSISYAEGPDLSVEVTLAPEAPA